MVSFQYWINSFPSRDIRNRWLEILSDDLDKHFHLVQRPLIWTSHASFLLRGLRSPPRVEVHSHRRCEDGCKVHEEKEHLWKSVSFFFV